MSKPEPIAVGNNIIEAGMHDDFADGYSNGYLYYYDTNHQFPRPLTTGCIYDFMKKNLFDQRANPQWNAGFVFGWIAACCENNSAFFFTSITIPAPSHEAGALTTVSLQEA